MAYMRMLCEFGRAWSHLRDRLPLECLLCRTRTPGGLCAYCRSRLKPQNPQQRCTRCDLIVNCVNWGQTPISRNRGLTPITPTTGCPDCAGLSASLVRVVAAFDYVWPGDMLIQALKQGGRFGSAPVLAALLAERCAALGLTSEQRQSAVVTAVPASRHALRRRGYNPAAEVGRYLARRLDLPWQPGLLLRTEQGAQQKHLGRAARRLQVQGLYGCRCAVAGRHILVVDDVMTTGSTLSAIAEALSTQGAAHVWGAVVARTPLRDNVAREQ